MRTEKIHQLGVSIGCALYDRTPKNANIATIRKEAIKELSKNKYAEEEISQREDYMQILFMGIGEGFLMQGLNIIDSLVDI